MRIVTRTETRRLYKERERYVVGPAMDYLALLDEHRREIMEYLAEQMPADEQLELRLAG